MGSATSGCTWGQQQAILNAVWRQRVVNLTSSTVRLRPMSKKTIGEAYRDEACCMEWQLVNSPDVQRACILPQSCGTGSICWRCHSRHVDAGSLLSLFYLMRVTLLFVEIAGGRTLFSVSMRACILAGTTVPETSHVEQGAREYFGPSSDDASSFVDHILKRRPALPTRQGDQSKESDARL